MVGQGHFLHVDHLASRIQCVVVDELPEEIPEGTIALVFVAAQEGKSVAHGQPEQIGLLFFGEKWILSCKFGNVLLDDGAIEFEEGEGIAGRIVISRVLEALHVGRLVIGRLVALGKIDGVEKRVLVGHGNPGVRLGSSSNPIVPFRRVAYNQKVASAKSPCVGGANGRFGGIERGKGESHPVPGGAEAEGLEPWGRGWLRRRRDGEEVEKSEKKRWRTQQDRADAFRVGCRERGIAAGVVVDEQEPRRVRFGDAPGDEPRVVGKRSPHPRRNPFAREDRAFRVKKHEQHAFVRPAQRVGGEELHGVAGTADGGRRGE